MATTEELMAQYGVAWFDFDEESGDVLDKLGGSYVGTVYANATRVQGWDNDGYAMNFNRTSTSYVDFNNKVIPTGNISLKFKIKLHTMPTSENQEIISNSYAQSTEAGLRIWANTAGDIVFSCMRKSSSNTSFALSKPALYDNKWHEYLFSWDADNNITKLYEDGELVAVDISVGGNSLTPTYNLRIGKQPDSSQARYFNGQIDDFQVYSKALSPSDFTQERLAIKVEDDKSLVLPDRQGRVKEIPSVDEADLINQGYTWREIDNAVDSTGVDLTVSTTEYEKVSKSHVALGNGKMFTIPVSDFKTATIEDNY